MCWFTSAAVSVDGDDIPKCVEWVKAIDPKP